DPGGAGDGAQRDAVVALLGEQVARLGDDLLAGLGRAGTPPRAPRHTRSGHLTPRRVTSPAEVTSQVWGAAARCRRANASASARSSTRSTRLDARRVLISRTMCPRKPSSARFSSSAPHGWLPR